MEEEIKKLREAGFTDADIQAYMNDQKSRQGQPQAVDPAQVDNSQPPIVDEKVPAYGAPPGTSMLEGVATVGAAVAPYALPAALAAAGGGGAYGLYKFGSKALDVGRGVNEQMVQRNAIEAAREARMANRPGFGGVPKTTPPMSGTPNFGAGSPGTAMPTTPYQMPTAGPIASQPAPMPSAPAAASSATPKPNMIQRGTDIANQMRQFAAQRVIPVMGQAGQMVGQGLSAAAPALRVGGMASNALYSGDLNANELAELERRRKMQPTITR